MAQLAPVPPRTAPAKQTICEREGAHRIFVATRVLTDNMVTVICVCTSCGEPYIIEYVPKGEIIAFGDDTPKPTAPK